MRTTDSRVVLARIQAWCVQVHCTPGSALARAIDYLSSRWSNAVRFLGDPRLPLDNNAAEHALRGLVLGRKNHYGSKLRRVTDVAGFFSTLLESAKHAGVEPAAYLQTAARAALESGKPPLPHEIAVPRSPARRRHDGERRGGPSKRRDGVRSSRDTHRDSEPVARRSCLCDRRETFQGDFKMSTFVLVHGAWHGGWCYRDTANLLRAQGHTVFTPTMSGAAEYSHAGHQGITLETNVRDILGVIEVEDLSDVILVGHSYGGMVGTSVADRVPEKIKHFVLLDAFAPEHGDSLMSLLDQYLPAEAAAAYRGVFFGSAAIDNARMMAPVTGAMFGMPEKETALMAKHCRPQSFTTFISPAFLTGAGDKIPRTCINAKDWQPSPFPYMVERAKKKGWKVQEIPGGHCVMLQYPEALTKMLLEAAA